MNVHRPVRSFFGVDTARPFLFVDMEVSRKKDFDFRNLGNLAEGEADYFTETVYASSYHTVNRIK